MGGCWPGIMFRKRWKWQKTFAIAALVLTAYTVTAQTVSESNGSHHHEDSLVASKMDLEPKTESSSVAPYGGNAVTSFQPTNSVAIKDATTQSVFCTETWCSTLGESELLALDAIRTLHRQIDDDKNGNIDFDESDEFLREELMYEGDYEKRQRLLHQDDDSHVSVKELWEGWTKSEVHNWTTDQTIEWLSQFVGLPQYSKNFLDNSVNGSVLPRLAANHLHVLSNLVGIKDLIHRQKIALKAQDVVLFGCPKDYHNTTKDSILTTLLVLALAVCWVVFCRYKSSQRDLNKMVRDMESLSKAEQNLMDLQKELEKAKSAQEVIYQGKTMEDELLSSDEISRLKGEVEVLRNELQRAEVELQDKCWVPPPALQYWLQLTYELELKAYNKKRQSAEKQLKQAKDAKRSSLMGAFVSTHGRSIDDVDKAILEAKTALTEITQELQERMHRWKQIEALINSPIMSNPGLPYLETILRGIGRGIHYNGAGSVVSNSQDDIDDDGASSIYCPSAVHKLVSQSTFMMYPGHEIPLRSYPLSSTIAKTNNENEDLKVDGPLARRISVQSSQLSQYSFNSSNKFPSSASDPNYVTQVSAPVSSIPPYQAPIVRSKSVSSMISLREKATTSSRESSNKDSSTGEDEINMDVSSSEITSTRYRRVTFGIRTDHRELISSMNQPRQLFKKEIIEAVDIENGQSFDDGNGLGITLEESNSSTINADDPTEMSSVDSTNAHQDSVGSEESSILNIASKEKKMPKIWRSLTNSFRNSRKNSEEQNVSHQKLLVATVHDKSKDRESYKKTFLTWTRKKIKPTILPLKNKDPVAGIEKPIVSFEKSG